MTAPRVFISYRTSDGADKATALARDLDAAFGAQQVFLDKDDLAGGSRWRDVIVQTLHARPVLLVLVTPQYLDGLDAQGRRRIEDPDDPVRTELAAALQAGAYVIPVLCDGVAAVPDVAALPPPLDQLGERTWRKLRAYDWRGDVARLVEDLRGLGLQSAAAPPPGASASPPAAGGGSAAPARRGMLVAGGAAVLLAAAGGAWWWQRRAAADLSGAWTAMLGTRGAAAVKNGTRIVFRVDVDGDQVRVVSKPVDIAADPAWGEYRAFWQERFKQELLRVVYRGQGSLRFDPGVPGEMVAAMRVESPTGLQIDGGQLRVQVGERGLRMRGTLWLNGEQGERVIELRRGE